MSSGSASGAAASSDGPSITTSLPSPDDWMGPVVAPHQSPTLKQLFRRRTGLVPAVVPYVAPHSWVYRPFLFLMNPDLVALDGNLCSKIRFVVARDNACRFCYGSFRSLLRVAGYSEAELDHLEGELSLNGRDSDEQAALEFAVDISQGRFQKGSVAALREAGYGDTAIREIAGIAAMATFLNRVATMLAVPLNEDLESLTRQWYFDLLQPVLHTLLRGWQRLRGTREPPLAAEAVEGPFAPWIERLRGTHVGHLAHDLTNQWLREESALSLQTKLFILAIVSRGLHVEALEEQAGLLLAEHCDVTTAAFEAVVDHLQGEVVDDRAAVLLRLARESIRYEAGRIQAIVREHTLDLTRAETIDAVATLGLTNALARLDALAPLDDE